MAELETLKNKAPVIVGDVIQVSVIGRAKEDYFGKHHGFIIFLKRMPREPTEGEVAKSKVTAVKENYAFADVRELL